MIYDAGPALGRTVIVNELHDQNRNLTSKGFRRDFPIYFLVACMLLPVFTGKPHFGVVSPVGAGRVQMPTNTEQEGIDKGCQAMVHHCCHNRAQLLKC